jgi:tetratricopeptide (TPR) repeat protein
LLLLVALGVSLGLIELRDRLASSSDTKLRRRLFEISRLSNKADNHVHARRTLLEFLQREADYDGPDFERRAIAAEAWALFSNLEEQANRPAEASAAIERAIALDSSVKPNQLVRIGKLEIALHNAPRAESALTEAVRLTPGLLDPRFNLIYLYGLQKRYRELDAQFQAISETNQLTYNHALHWTICRTPAWEATEGEADLLAFVEADTHARDRASRRALAELWISQGKLDDATKLLWSLPDRDPDVLYLLAQIPYKKGDLAATQQILENAPAKHAGLERLRGTLALAQSRPADAVAHFRVALEAEPYHRENVAGLGQALRLSGHTDEAKRYLDQVRLMDRLTGLLKVAGTESGINDPTMPSRLGAVCESLGRFDQAQVWYRLALVRDPLDSEAQSALFRIRQNLPNPGPSPNESTAEPPSPRPRATGAFPP